MRGLNVHNAKTDLSRMADPAAEGEEMITAEPRKPGRLKGRIRIGPGFEDSLPDEILAALRGEGE